MEAALYVVATPLGNLQDITLRALSVLGAVEVVAAEDTRVVRRLLDHHGIRTAAMAVHEHNESAASRRVIELIGSGKSVALVSDAGTPAISDPGAVLVRKVREAGLAVTPIPGPSALTAAVSVAGLDIGQFLFLGFLPATAAARRKALERVARQPVPIVLYEAPHRVRETVDDIALTMGAARGLFIARELTKLFEQFHRCPAGEAAAWLDADANHLRGEFVLIVDAAPAEDDAQAAEAERVLRLLLDALPLKQAVQLASEITGARRNLLYDRGLAIKQEGKGPTA